MNNCANRSLSGIFCKVLKLHNTVSLLFFNVFIGLLLLNMAIIIIYFCVDHLSKNPVEKKYGQFRVASLYPNFSAREIDALLNETWSRPFTFEPYTQFKEAQFQGDYVNVTNVGFRKLKNQGPWPPQQNSFNIFLFGGSTTFGYGVADDETIASYLQECLTTKLDRDVRVYNFGRGHYYSTQERILFEQLLSSGVVPSMAIFIDGLNDFWHNDDQPLYAHRFQEFMASGKFMANGKANDNAGGRGLIWSLPLMRAVGDLQAAFAKKARQSGTSEKNNDRYNDPVVIARVIKKYLANKSLIEAVSRAFGVSPFFVWQPVPTYHYEQKYHPFADGGYGRHTYSIFGYEHMAKLESDMLLGSNFLWCADLQKDANEPLYVDKVHYSAKFSKVIAAAIADLAFARYSAQQ